MEITKDIIKAIMPNASSNVSHNKNWIVNGKAMALDEAVVLLNKYAKESGITSALHWVYYLATIAVESGEFRYSEETASGKAYDTGKLAIRLGNTPEADGDGQKYKGRGLIQYTGKANYQEYSKWCGFDVVKQPELLAYRVGSFRSAAHYFGKYCLTLANKDDSKGVRKRVNGGLNGYKEFCTYVDRGKKALGLK